MRNAVICGYVRTPFSFGGKGELTKIRPDDLATIAANAGDVFICAGVESMSRVPMGGYNPLPNPKLYEAEPGAYMSMGETAENVATRWHISRSEQEAFAYE